MRIVLMVFLLIGLFPMSGQSATPRTSVDSSVVNELERFGRVDLLVTFRGPPPVRERGRTSQRLGEIREEEFSQLWESFESHMGKSLEGLEVTGASLVSMKVSMTVYDRDTFDRLRRFPRLQSIQHAQPVVRIGGEEGR